MVAAMGNDALEDLLLRVVDSLGELLEEAGRPVSASLLRQQLEEWQSELVLPDGELSVEAQGFAPLA